MLISYNWLQTFFTEKLPEAEALAEVLNTHSLEVEEIKTVGEDKILEVKVLPDKSAWLLSHRGLAKEIATCLGLKMTNDLFLKRPTLNTTTDKIEAKIETPLCSYYGAALISKVKVAPSPAWLKEVVEAIGQRSINNIVDITNYIMFGLGQPLHAFAASKLGGETKRLLVRAAGEGEAFTSLSGEAYTLTTTDMVIADGVTGEALALAGVKGGLSTGIDDDTTDIIWESAHFDRGAVRLQANRHKIPTDAAKRFENGVPKDLAAVALQEAVRLVTEVAGGELTGFAIAGDTTLITRPSVSVTLAKVNSVLGLSLTIIDIKKILDQFGYDYQLEEEKIIVTPPWERDDLVIPEDLIEEFGRMYGLEHIKAITPVPVSGATVNQRFYYSEVVRQTLLELGFSEVYTSSFQKQDVVKIKNALASDKSYLRSNLLTNLAEAVTKNIAHKDLLGLSTIKIFEIGTVFSLKDEDFVVGLAVQSGTAYKAKNDDKLLAEALTALQAALGIPLGTIDKKEGCAQFSLNALLSQLPIVTSYQSDDLAVETTEKSAPVFHSFSNFPTITRDLAMWTPVGTTAESVWMVFNNKLGKYCQRATLFDEFTKDGQVSFAFRLVFQAKDKTLTDTEVESVMTAVYEAIVQAGFTAR